jgi:hypothetical protein
MLLTVSVKTSYPHNEGEIVKAKTDKISHSHTDINT